MTPEEIKTQIAEAIRDAIKWHRHDGVLTQRVNLFEIFQFQNRWNPILNDLRLGFSLVMDTNGTTPVNLFGTQGAPYPFRVTAVYVISKDTTAGNISLLQASNTVCTIAKGTVAGVMTGATSLSNTDYQPGDACQVVSSSAGNATVIIHIILPVKSF